ncbi:DUF6221 family protein [Streptomyces sp. NPDC054987]
MTNGRIVTPVTADQDISPRSCYELLGELAGFHPTIALHVALHDPARVLREIEAKRHVLARHLFSPAIGDPELPWDNRDDCQYDGEPWPCDDLLDLALPYVDHPDYPRHL